MAVAIDLERAYNRVQLKLLMDLHRDTLTRWITQQRSLIVNSDHAAWELELLLVGSESLWADPKAHHSRQSLTKCTL